MICLNLLLIFTPFISPLYIVSPPSEFTSVLLYNAQDDDYFNGHVVAPGSLFAVNSHYLPIDNECSSQTVREPREFTEKPKILDKPSEVKEFFDSFEKFLHVDGVQMFVNGLFHSLNESFLTSFEYLFRGFTNFTDAFNSNMIYIYENTFAKQFSIPDHAPYITYEEFLGGRRVGNFIADAFLWIMRPFFTMLIETVADVTLILITVVTKLEQQIEKLVEVVVNLLENIFDLIMKILFILEQKYYLFEFVIGYLLIFYFVQNIYISLLITFGISISIGFTRSFENQSILISNVY